MLVFEGRGRPEKPARGTRKPLGALTREPITLTYTNHLIIIFKGLDPASLYFENARTSFRLDKSDALYAC